MSLILTNKATDKQKAFLVELEYVGTGKYTIDRLTTKEAADLIDELIQEQKSFYDEMDATEDDLY